MQLVAIELEYVDRVAAALEAAGVPVVGRFSEGVLPPEHFIATTLGRAVVDVGWGSASAWFVITHLRGVNPADDELSGRLTADVDADPGEVVRLVVAHRERVRLRLREWGDRDI